MGELKDYLSFIRAKCYGQKRELVARAFSASKRNVGVVVNDEELRSRLDIEYKHRINGLPSDPRSIGDWKNDLTTWPAIDLKKIFSFICLRSSLRMSMSENTTCAKPTPTLLVDLWGEYIRTIFMLKASVFCMPVYRRTSPSLVICAEAVHSVHSIELPLISIGSLAGLSPLSSDLKSEGPVYTVDLLVVEVVVTLYSNRRLFLGDLVLECSKRLGKSGQWVAFGGFPS